MCLDPLRRSGLFGWIIATSFALPVSATEYTVTTIADDLELPWSVAEMPDGNALVTEKVGRLQHIAQDGTITAINGVPTVYYASQGGLLDVVLHPEFTDNQALYLSFAGGDQQQNRTTVVRATLAEHALDNVTTILEVSRDKDTPVHYGGKLAFMADGSLLVSVGEGFSYREEAQSLNSELGKLLRVNDDGSIPTDNPFPDKAPRVYSYGHRNPQGLAYDATHNQIWMHEHGPKGGDELNRIDAGANYGWPAITYGLDYSGAIISPYQTAVGMEQPVIYWVPSIGPSGMAIYRGNMFPDWQGDILIGSLIDHNLRRLRMVGGSMVEQPTLLDELDLRIRDVRVFRDGSVYLTTDEGQLLRISAK